MPDPHIVHEPAPPTSTGSKPYPEQCVTLLIFSFISHVILCIDLDLNIQPSLTVMALPLPLRSGLRRVVDYPPIRGLCVRFLRDCVPRAVVVSMCSHPRHRLDIPAMRIHFSTTYPFLIPPLLVLILNPGIHRQRE